MICKMKSCSLSVWLVRQPPDLQKYGHSHIFKGCLGYCSRHCQGFAVSLSLPLQCLSAWFPLARTCIYLPFLALKSALPSHAAGWKCWRMNASCPQWSIGLIPHSSLAAYSSLFHFPAPLHCFLGLALKSATCTQVLFSKLASGGNQARTIIFSQRSWQLSVLGDFTMSRFQLRRTYIRILEYCINWAHVF